MPRGVWEDLGKTSQSACERCHQADMQLAGTDQNNGLGQSGSRYKSLKQKALGSVPGLPDRGFIDKLIVVEHRDLA